MFWHNVISHNFNLAFKGCEAAASLEMTASRLEMKRFAFLEMIAKQS